MRAIEPHDVVNDFNEPADLRSSLTNEMTINKLSLAFDKIYGLPAVKYELVRYEQETSNGGIEARIHLEHGKTKVIVRVTGPCIDGSRMDWGLRVGRQYVQEIPTDDGTRVVIIDGYLKPG